MTSATIRDSLLSLAEEGYRSFMSSLLPTVSPERVLGVRMPLLRKMAKGMIKDGSAKDYLIDLPHFSHEENLLHALILNEMRELDSLYDALHSFLPCVDNWAVCDSLRPRGIVCDRQRLYDSCKEWARSNHPYTVRFGMEMLMCFFLDEHFKDEVFSLVLQVEQEDYYVKMMQAWFFAEAAAKQFDAVLPYFRERRFSPWVHKKAISKVLDSRRISRERKELLRRTLYSPKK